MCLQKQSSIFLSLGLALGITYVRNQIWPSNPNSVPVLFSACKLAEELVLLIGLHTWLPGKGRVENQHFSALEDCDYIIPVPQQKMFCNIAWFCEMHKHP